MKAPHKRLSGSSRRKIHEIITGTGKFSPRMVAKREAKRSRKGLCEI